LAVDLEKIRLQRRLPDPHQGNGGYGNRKASSKG